MKQFLFSCMDIILNMESTFPKMKTARLQQSHNLQCHAISTAFLFSLTQKKSLIPEL